MALTIGANPVCLIHLGVGVRPHALNGGDHWTEHTLLLALSHARCKVLDSSSQCS